MGNSRWRPHPLSLTRTSYLLSIERQNHRYSIAIDSSQMNSLMVDAQYWIENKVYSWDAIGARFYHSLVAIHAFPNDNGRHARLATEIGLTSNGQENFTWGSKKYSASLNQFGALRSEYIAALRETDQQRFNRIQARASWLKNNSIRPLEAARYLSLVFIGFLF